MNNSIKFLIELFSRFSKPGKSWLTYYGHSHIISIPNDKYGSVYIVKGVIPKK